MILLQFKNLTIRNADVHDAAQLALWWNDGKIMAHAGFPNGTGETADGIAENLAKNSDKTGRTLIVDWTVSQLGKCPTVTLVGTPPRSVSRSAIFPSRTKDTAGYFSVC